MADTRSNDMASGDKTYTYREYLEQFARSSEHKPNEPEERKPSEVGKEMAKKIIERLFAHK